LKKGGIVVLQAGGKGKAVRERPITDSDGSSRDVSVDEE
jgi:hypothetical protein